MILGLSDGTTLKVGISAPKSRKRTKAARRVDRSGKDENFWSISNGFDTKKPRVQSHGVFTVLYMSERRMNRPIEAVGTK